MASGKVTFKTNEDGTVIIGEKRLMGSMSARSLLRYLAYKAGIHFPDILLPNEEIIFEVTIVGRKGTRRQKK